MVIVCSGEQCGDYYEKIQKRIEELRIGDSFRFCGWVTAREILSSADALMLPSLQEGFGLNCIEAMFMRIPVLRTQTAGYHDMRDYCVGMEDASSETVLKYIRRVLLGDALSQERTERAEAFVHEQCTVKVMTEHTVAVYKDVLKKQ